MRRAAIKVMTSREFGQVKRDQSGEETRQVETARTRAETRCTARRRGRGCACSGASTISTRRSSTTIRGARSPRRRASSSSCRPLPEAPEKAPEKADKPEKGEKGKDGKGGKKPSPPKSLKMRRSVAVGKAIAAVAIEKGIKAVAFDRGGYLYHGRVAALAKAAREGGLEF